MLKSGAAWGCVLVAVAFLVGAGPAFAWELDVKAEWAWEFKYYSQLGTNGFFGPYDVVRPGAGFNERGLATYNGWLGEDITGRYIVTGSDAAATMMWAKLYPKVRVNKAVSVQGSLYVGSYKHEERLRGGGGEVGWVFSNFERTWNDDSFGEVRVPSYRLEYFTEEFAGSQTNFAPLSFTTLWADFRLPWGTLLLGKRPFRFGTGLMFDGEDNTSTESVTLAAPYGPLTVGILWYPWRRANDFREFHVVADMNGARDTDIGAFALYEAGPVSMGALIEYFQYDIGVEAYRWRQTWDAERARRHVTKDVAGTLGSLFLKYFNGRFFLNAELAWYDQITRHRRNQSGETNTGPIRNRWYTGSIFAPHYIEHWRATVEPGAVAGPMKVTALWAWVSGPDRRGTGDGDTGLHSKSGDLRGQPIYSNYSLFRPYSILLVGNYGMGNNSFTSPALWDGRGIYMFQQVPVNQRRKIPGSAHGYVTDASVLAARVDYSVAANLNVFASFLHAERVSHGYPWAYIGLSGFKGFVQYRDHPNFYDDAANVPNTSLGWEVDAGFDWKLLEGVTLGVTFAYWEPGKWFKHACYDKSQGEWDDDWDDITNPDRAIDQIFGTNVKVGVDF